MTSRRLRRQTNRDGAYFDIIFFLFFLKKKPQVAFGDIMLPELLNDWQGFRLIAGVDDVTYRDSEEGYFKIDLPFDAPNTLR